MSLDVYKRQGYSNTENYSAKYANYLDDTKNGVTFYWNIYNFDAARFGNQGLFAARSMMAMAIYLDNEIMYDRAYRYLLGMKHLKDDLPYPSGPVSYTHLASAGQFLAHRWQPIQSSGLMV